MAVVCEDDRPAGVGRPGTCNGAGQGRQCCHARACFHRMAGGSAKGGGVRARAGRKGLAAAYVADANDVVNSKHLRSRDYFEKTRLNDGGEIGIPSRPYRAQRMGWSNRPAPVLGQHTRDVFVDELGVGTDEFDRLVEKKVV